MNLRGEFIVNNEEESSKLAKEIAESIKAKDIVIFQGDLGVGKTFFCRRIIQELCGPNVTVASPTFNLLQVYNAEGFDIYHFDLYRLKHPDEIYELGIEEAFADHLTLIEWPEIIMNFLPTDTICINITIMSDTKRRITIKS